jgi:hypothetical protein
LNPGLRAFLLRVPHCDFLFQPHFYEKCGEVVVRGPDENTQKSVMGRYFPGRALPPSVTGPNLDLRFQPPGKPNGLAKKWAKIAGYRCGLIVGPSGSGKVICSLISLRLSLILTFSLLSVRSCLSQTSTVFHFSASERKWCLYAYASSGARESDPSVRAITTRLEEHILKVATRTQSKEESPQDPDKLLQSNLDRAVALCQLHWLSRMLVLYLCLLKNPNLSQSQWLRYQLYDGRVSLVRSRPPVRVLSLISLSLS